MHRSSVGKPPLLGPSSATFHSELRPNPMAQQAITPWQYRNRSTVGHDQEKLPHRHTAGLIPAPRFLPHSPDVSPMRRPSAPSSDTPGRARSPWSYQTITIIIRATRFTILQPCEYVYRDAARGSAAGALGRHGGRADRRTVSAGGFSRRRSSTMVTWSGATPKLETPDKNTTTKTSARRRRKTRRTTTSGTDFALIERPVGQRP